MLEPMTEPTQQPTPEPTRRGSTAVARVAGGDEGGVIVIGIVVIVK
jgi:hypothetical protein